MAQLNFNASNVEITERGVLPAGDYEMIIIKSDTKPTKAGNGHYLELEMQVIGGAFSGRRYWERLNLNNPNQQAVKIAEEQLARLCKAIGLEQVEDSEELHDKAFIATIGIDKKDPTRNVVWDYQPVDGAAPAPAAKPAAVAAPAAAGRPARPW
jgi:hypothetical protein